MHAWQTCLWTVQLNAVAWEGLIHVSQIPVSSISAAFRKAEIYDETPTSKIKQSVRIFCQIIFKRHLRLQFYQTAYLGCSFLLLSFQRFEQKVEEI